VLGFFQDRILWTIFPDWLQTMILLISASWVARITGVSHQHQTQSCELLFEVNIPKTLSYWLLVDSSLKWIGRLVYCDGYYIINYSYYFVVLGIKSRTCACQVTI
jgi:hypothetical protein